MSIAALEPSILLLGPGAAGMMLAPDEFDAAEFEDGFRYERIHGVLVVSPAPLPQERDPNDELGHHLRSYRQNHPHGGSLDNTLPEHDIMVGDDRRRADRVIWAGLGRQPRVDEMPTIVVEFVSVGKRSLTRDYEVKRREYLVIGVQEYWVFNRFNRTLTVFHASGKKVVLGENQTYSTPLLPGFELPLARLFELANRWDAS
ncbi:MAG: Uma2 family endonuclease [Pirellulaceae bacterium]|nr:Uma2 family endonuclease [Pirellulaceae bacterium]